MIQLTKYIIEYSLTTPFDISTANISFSGNATYNSRRWWSGQMTLPHAIEFKPDGTECIQMK